MIDRAWIVALAWAAGCRSPAAPSPEPERAGPAVAVPPDLLERLGSALPGLEVVGLAGDRAWQALLRGEVQVVVVDAPPGPEPDRRARDLGLGLSRRPLLSVEIQPVVHVSNPVRSVAPGTLRGLFDGSLARWDALGGEGAVVPVLAARDTLARRCLEAALGTDRLVEVGSPRRDGAAVARGVASLPGGIGALPRYEDGLSEPGIAPLEVVEPSPGASGGAPWPAAPCSLLAGTLDPPGPGARDLAERVARGVVVGLSGVAAP